MGKIYREAVTEEDIFYYSKSGRWEESEVKKPEKEKVNDNNTGASKNTSRYNRNS